MGILDKLKKLLGGSHSSGGSANKIRQANRTTNYGGGVSTTSTASFKRAYIKKKKEEAEKTKAVANAFKATTPTAQKTGVEIAKTAKESSPKSSGKPDAFNRSNAFKATSKATPPSTKRSTALGGLSESDIKTRTAKMNAAQANRKEQSRAADKLKPLIDAKYSNGTVDAKRRMKMGEYMSDPDVAKYETLKHPVASSLARGGLSGATFGLSELAAQKLPSSKEMKEAEAIYQANKSKPAEFIGEMAGSLASFGLTGGLSKEALAKAAPKTTAKIGESTTKWLAKNKFIVDAARKEAIRKIGISATEDEIARFAAARAAKLVSAVGEDMAINLTTGAVSDVAHAIIDSDNPAEFAKNMAISAGMNLGLGGLTTVAPALYRGSELDESMRAMGNDVADFGRDVARNMDNKSGGIKIGGDAPRGAAEGAARSSLLTESRELDDEYWAIVKEIEDEYGSINPNFGTLSPEERAVIVEKKTRLREINARKEEITGELNGSRSAKTAEPPAPKETPKAEPKIRAESETKTKTKTKAKTKAETPNTGLKEADEAASKFRKSRSKANEKIKERYKHIAEIYDSDKKGQWVFYRDKLGELCVGDPRAEHGRIRDGYGWKDNGDYFGKLTRENFEKAKKAFDDGNTEPYVSKSKKGTKPAAEKLEPKEKPEVDTLKTYKSNRLKENPDAKFGGEKEAPRTEPPEAKAKAKTSEPKAETAVATRNDVATAGENAKAGEKTKAGERTEFKRGEGATEKEKARNKRTEKRAKATQEDFDREFAEFEKKIGENREKVSKLNGRMRAAATEEERQAIKKEIDALDEEIKRMHHRASLKYHPDMGGSNEWAQKFNDAYRDYQKRVYSSPNFSGASSKSSTGGTRNNTYREYRQKQSQYRSTSKGANGGGANTPPPKSGAGGGGANTPPPKGGNYADYDGLRRPKGYAKRTQRAMEDVEDMVGATKPNTTWREAARTFKDEANRKFVDSLKDFEGVARERLKTHGKEAMQKLYGAIDKARRYRAVATTSVGSHQMKWDGTRYQVKGADGVMRDAPSIAEIFSGMDKKKEKAFNAYLLLNHNVDRLREGKAVFKDTVLYNEELSKALGLGKDIDLMDADVCKKLAENYEAQFSDFKDRAAQIRQYTANELNNRVQAGLLAQEDMDELLHKYPNYVPTYRAGLFDSVGAIKGATITPSDLKAAKGSDLNVLDIKEQLADATVRNWRDISLNNLLEKTFGENIAANLNNFESLEGAHTLVLDHTMNVGKTADGGKFYADIYRNGKRERVEIEKRFYDDLKDLYKNGRLGNGLDMFNDKILVPLADKWKKLITEWSPIFMVKNAMRDFPEAIINSRSRKEFLSITADGSALKDILHNGKFSQSLRDAGISASTFIDIDKAVKDFEKGEGGLKTLIPKLNAGVELYPRLVEYMATIKKAGYDLNTVKIEDIPMDIRDMAAANAADVTVNFGRSGSVGKLINKGAIPFFNPSIQGWSKFARNITELDGFKDTVGFLISATALGAAPMVATNLLYQNNPNYQQISARDKANNYIIAIPPFDDNADKFIKIPRSRFASVYGLPLVNVANENKANWATAIQIVNDQVAPLNPIESHLGANLIQAARNKTWYGTPIESEAMKSIPANERYDATTSGISVGTAKALNKVTKGKVKVSPKKLDYVLDANFGVVADVALPLTTKANRGTNVPAQVANIGKKAFMIDSATQNDLSTRYYDKATLLEQNKNSSEATEEDAVAYKKFTSWDSRVKGITNAMRYIQSSDIPNKQEAYRELAKLRNEDMKKALDGKVSINNTRDIDIIHKYAGTSYTIENLGKSADQKALKAYGAAVYGNLSESAMKKRIDKDTEFYKGYEGIVETQNALQKANPSLKGGNALTYAVGLANAGASDDVFAAYNTTVQSRTESASKAQRAKDYLKNNGSIEEFAQLENVVKNLGKLPDVDKGNLEDEAYERLQSGKMTIDEYNTELKKIAYNANQSYVGKAVSLAQSGAPARAYNLYDIKERNVQKGYNLAAMGIDSRKYREMSQACDADGNGYLKTAEIRAYVDNSDIQDKATLFDALCYYPNVRNPYGTPKRYSSEQAAKAGKRDGVAQISANEGRDDTVFVESSSSGSGGGYGGYYRRGGYRRSYRRYGGGKAKAPKHDISAFKAKNNNVSIKRTSTPKAVGNYTKTTAKPKIALKVKAAKPSKASKTVRKTALSTALDEVKKTQKKVAPPKARSSK